MAPQRFVDKKNGLLKTSLVLCCVLKRFVCQPCSLEQVFFCFGKAIHGMDTKVYSCGVERSQKSSCFTKLPQYLKHWYPQRALCSSQSLVNRQRRHTINTTLLTMVLYFPYRYRTLYIVCGRSQFSKEGVCLHLQYSKTYHWILSNDTCVY